MRTLALFILLFSSKVRAQNYTADIEKHREVYKQNFLIEPQSPLAQEDLQFLNFYPADSTYRIVANVQILSHQKVFKMPTFSGDSSAYYRYAKVIFQLNGKYFQLTLYKSVNLAMHPVYKDYLFLPFTDDTNGKDTYGGGRYIDLKSSKVINNKIEIDFNKAYNPYCAYSDGYRCPVPPPENNLNIAIPVGEKMFLGSKKHSKKP